MTFTRVENLSADQIHKTNKLTDCYGEMLMNCLIQALDSNRLTSGVSDCAKLLSRYPENVMFCILPEAASENISVHIQHILIEAFCWENDIRILKVKLSNRSTSKEGKNGVRKLSSDTNCLLLEYPKDQLSTTDDEIVDYYDTLILNDTFPKPEVELPV
ncbi:hypothetical protein LOTGIDRAFT_227883 [Lottia gigantea]|uniref:Uncharacterized protein n=1 Tax=Lottia gigantea TaxID=225164 RepID=V4AM09_LOTGI|nr:hypothetical protein LOTGIDRAFT_227883 [Lottia gigantea]ESP05224.1 hypothetical protein LOTGIDRAFT_227883 [Lottia gigantea]